MQIIKQIGLYIGFPFWILAFVLAIIFLDLPSKVWRQIAALWRGYKHFLRLDAIHAKPDDGFSEDEEREIQMFSVTTRDRRNSQHP